MIQKIIPALVALLLAAPVAAQAEAYRDVLDVPARPSAYATKSLLNGLALAGSRVVAVGQRGHVVISDDAGKNWRQAKVPVSSDLVAVSFPNAEQGWAVGHDGVVLHSADGGQSWDKQLDGRAIGRIYADYYAAEAAAGRLGNAEQASRLLEEAQKIAGQGAEGSLLDVWFADNKTGFVVGAFNLILRTEDGGKTWTPWYHRTDNPNRLHLYAIRKLDAGLFVVGEQGLLMKLDDAAQRFGALDAGYRGTWFGLAGSGATVLVHGLRGNAYRSTDGGRLWAKVETGLPDGITGSARCGDWLVLVSQSGRLLIGDSAANNLSPLKAEQATPGSAVVCQADTLIVAGARGVRTQSFK